MEARVPPPVSVPALAPARLDTVPVRAAVRTEMVPPQAVTAKAGAEQAKFGRKDPSRTNETRQTDASFDLDRETGELIYKVIDKETQGVVSQYPYDSLLKLRAYIRAQDEREGS